MRRFELDTIAEALRLRMMDSQSAERSGDPADSGRRELGGGLFGYRRQPVDEFLRQVGETIAAIQAEKAELADRIGGLEADLARRRDLERLLRTTLISTERAADAVRQRARTEADQILEAARGQARKLVAAAIAEREKLVVQRGERGARLRTALAILQTERAAPTADALDEALLEQARRTAD